MDLPSELNLSEGMDYLSFGTNIKSKPSLRQKEWTRQICVVSVGIDKDVYFKLRDLASARGTGNQVPFLSLSRFGPGTISLMSILIIISILFVRYKFYYFAIIPAIIALLIFGVKSIERIEYGRAEVRNLIGQRCFVVKTITKNERGVVKVCGEQGKIYPETWSAESVNGEEIQQNQYGRIVGMKSIILLVEPQS